MTEEQYIRIAAMFRVGKSSVEIYEELEPEFLNALELREIIGEASVRVAKFQADAFQAGIEAAQAGQSRHDVARLLRLSWSFHPFDSETVAGRCMQRAAELAKAK
jgi:hypothetical protein